MTAYGRFTAASNTAERVPDKKSNGNALSGYSIDPALGGEQSDLINYTVNHIDWRGTPPRSRSKVTVSNFNATPYPTVTIVDCPTISKTWRPYNSQTGQPLKLVTPNVAPPWATTATVVHYKTRWVVQSRRVDMTRTCKP